MTEDSDPEGALRELVWVGWREAWREQASMSELSALDEKTARSRFERWWQKR